MSPARNVTDDEWEVAVEPYPETYVFENPGDVLQGTFLSVKQIEQTGLDGNPRTVNVYTVEDSDGHKWGVWGNYNIDEAMKEVSEGYTVRFEFHGKVPIDNGARTVNQFTVKFRKA